MANPKHLSILKKGVNAWNQWRNDNPGIKPDLKRAVLSPPDSPEDSLGWDLRGANLHAVDLTAADFMEADLSGSDLSSVHMGFASLFQAVLVGANLRGARVHDAHLHMANLSRANLCDASFAYSALTECRLVEADLTNASLPGTTFGSSDLTRANLSGALLGATVFGATVLRDVIGLETCQHQDPSVIDYFTLIQSDRLPDAFLRGCGLPDAVITYIPSFYRQPIQFYSCFISYSHTDERFARLLHDTLQGSGIRCWLDEKQLLPGDDIYEHVDRGIRLWDKVLLCCSQSALTSWWVDNEIGKAFVKEQQLMKERGKKILSLMPLNLDGYLFKWQDGKADEVRRRLAADFTGWAHDVEKFGVQVQNVIRALRADESARETPPVSRL